MLTERKQKRLLYHLFTDPKYREHDTSDLDGVEPDPLEFTEPWKTIYLRAANPIRAVRGVSDLYQGVQYVAEDDEDVRRLMIEIEAAAAPIHYMTLAEMAADLKPVTWLWENWIPRGMLSLLGAYQGGGKSYFVMDLARAVIAGDQWPDGTPVTDSGRVVYVDAEAIPQVNNERAQKLAVDTTQLYLVVAKENEFIDLNTLRWRERLWDMVGDLQPELVIVDSLSTISLKGQNSVEDITQLLMFLVQLARHGDCGMLVLHHLRKPPGGQTTLPGISIHDFRGSSHITAMARTVLGLSVVQTSGQQFSLNGARRVEIAKTNLGPYPEPLGLTLIEEGDTARFEYGVASGAEHERTSRDACETWLLDYLEEHGPTRPADVVDDGKEQGYSRATIYRARKSLGDQIVNSKGRNAPQNRWRLPGGGEDEVEE